MFNYLLKILMVFLIAGCLAGPALGDDVVIDNSDGPVKITIRNTKSQAQSASSSLNHEATMELIQEVLAEYSSKNKYSKLTQTQCKQMSEAIWYRLRVKGLDVRLAGGNVERKITGLGFEHYANLANHAWVMAKTPERGWLALECTSGGIISREENELYYTSAVFFRTPEEVYRFDGRRRDAHNAYVKLNKLVEQWNTTYAGKRLQVKSELYNQRQAHQESMTRAKEDYIDIVDRLERLYNGAQELK
ncbi:MAG: hypothetical protein KKE73_13055 [Proteobacteria bacterium]|nr:hypothetical protein [Pseudomonadota bacterium]